VKKGKGRKSATDRTLSPGVMTSKEWMKSRGKMLKGLPQFEGLKEIISAPTHPEVSSTSSFQPEVSVASHFQAKDPAASFQAGVTECSIIPEVTAASSLSAGVTAAPTKTTSELIIRVEFKAHRKR